MVSAPSTRASFVIPRLTILVDVTLPDVEAAVVLKACAWGRRCHDKDVADLATLFEIAHHHRHVLLPWQLGRAEVKGSRRDALQELNLLRGQLDRGRYAGVELPTSAARLSALIREYARG